MEAEYGRCLRWSERTRLICRTPVVFLFETLKRFIICLEASNHKSKHTTHECMMLNLRHTVDYNSFENIRDLTALVWFEL